MTGKAVSLTTKPVSTIYEILSLSHHIISIYAQIYMHLLMTAAFKGNQFNYKLKAVKLIYCTITAFFFFSLAL